MTVSSTSSRVVYNGNGSTMTFPFGFKVQQAADLAVIYTDTTSTDVTLSASQYGATGFGVDSGGTVTYPLSGSPIALGTTLTIYRKVAVTQPTSISNQGAMWPQMIEAALDRLTYIAQNVGDAVSRALVISPTDSGSLSVLPNRTQRANAVLGFDGAGQPYAAQLVAGLGAASAWLVANFFPMNSAASARSVLGAIAAGDNTAFTGANTFPTPAAGDNSQKAATTAYADRSAASAVGAFVLRSYLAGLQLSTAGSSASFAVAAGMAADSANAATIALASSLIKTTSAWAPGTSNGALDTGAIAGNSWYHIHLVKCADTGAVDVLASLNVTSPSLPANYTLSRRIGAMRTDGSANWMGFVQDGDYFRWKAAVLDVNEAAPSASAQLKTLSVPSGVNVHALVNVAPVFPDGVDNLYISDPAANDDAPSGSAAPLYDFTSLSLPAGASPGGQRIVRTDQSSHIRYRFNHASGGNALKIVTLGWIDHRGRDL